METYIKSRQPTTSVSEKLKPQGVMWSAATMFKISSTVLTPLPVKVNGIVCAESRCGPLYLMVLTTKSPDSNSTVSNPSCSSSSSSSSSSSENSPRDASMLSLRPVVPGGLCALPRCFVRWKMSLMITWFGDPGPRSRKSSSQPETFVFNNAPGICASSV